MLLEAAGTSSSQAIEALTAGGAHCCHRGSGVQCVPEMQSENMQACERKNAGETSALPE